MSHRVVITGMGVSAPVGRGIDTFWENLLAGRSGIGPISLFDASSFPVRIGGEVKDLDLQRLAQTFVEAAAERDRKLWLGLDAASQALQDAKLESDQLSEALLLIGVSLETFSLDQLALAHMLPGAPASSPAGAAGARGAGGDAGAPGRGVTGGGVHGNITYDLLQLRRHARPLQTPLDRTAQLVGDHYGIHGGRYTNCSACAAGTQAIGEGFQRLRDGSATVAIAGATDSVLNPLGLGGFSLLRILSAENERPEQACRPFDATRQGTVLAEGAAFLVLEQLEHAARRGARVYAEIVGYGCSLDAFRLTDPEPNGRGAALSMARALKDAGLNPTAIDCINAHGTGTPKNDLAETLALKSVFGLRAPLIPVTANKSMTGHLIAASGAVEAVASALTLSTGRIPPTINLTRPDPACNLDYVALRSRDFSGKTVLSNSFGFGGQNATLVFAKLNT